VTAEQAHRAGERAETDGLRVAGPVPADMLRGPLIRPFLEVVDRVTVRSGFADPIDLPFATITVTVDNVPVLLAEGLQATLDGTCRIITLDLGAQSELLHADGSRLQVGREAAALIIAVLFLQRARGADDIPDDERTALVGMFHVARHAAFAKYPTLARQFLE
jgi:hypothetical protein